MLEREAAFNEMRAEMSLLQIDRDAKDRRVATAEAGQKEIELTLKKQHARHQAQIARLKAKVDIVRVSTNYLVVSQVKDA